MKYDIQVTGMLTIWGKSDLAEKIAKFLESEGVSTVIDDDHDGKCVYLYVVSK